MPTLSCEQLQDRLVALHRASLELVQDISLETLLERIGTIAAEQAGAQFAAVGVLDENGEMERFIPLGMTPEQLSAMPHPPVGLGLIGALMHSPETIRLSDLTRDPRAAGFPKGHPPMTSFLGVPIHRGSQQLGQIYLTNKLDGQAFTEDDQQVIEMLAAYAAVALANARLYKDLVQRDKALTRRTENLALLNQLASTLATASDIDQILEQALDQVMGYLRPDVGEVYLRQEESKLLRLVLHRGELVPMLWASEQYQIGQSVIGQTARSGTPQRVTVDSESGRAFHQNVRGSGIQQAACFPLSGRRGAQGVLCVASHFIQPMDEIEMQFINAICAWVGTAIENVRLSLQGKRLVILEERERIGMDLHDGIIQSIYAVGLTLEHARLILEEEPDQAKQRIEQANADLNKAIRDIRAYILDLRPRHLLDETLLQGIQRLANEFHANTLMEVGLQGPAEGLVKLPDAQAIALFHICQEALANIAKHAHARKVDVVVWSTTERILLEVRDDGRGFDPDKVRLTIGHGLSNMQTRARNVGGDVDITSEPDTGTTVLAWVPNTEDETN